MRHKKVKTCSRCGQLADIVTHRTICRSCNLERKRGVAARAQSTETGAALNRTKTAAYRQTPRGRAGVLLWFSNRRAKDIGVAFALDAGNIAARIAKGYCEVTGLQFDMTPAARKHHSNPWAPSLDRKDSSGGYTPDNVQVVVAAYNYAKSEWTAEVLLKLARAIVDRAPETGV